MKKSGIFIFVFTFVIVFLSFGFSHHYKELSYNVFGRVTAGIYNASENLRAFFKKSAITEENEHLRTMLALTDSYKEENKLLKEENENLRELLSLEKELPLKKKAAADVIGISEALDFTITVNRGKSQGIKEGDIAVWGNTLVGKVSEVFSDFSYITPITAPDTSIGIVTENEDVGIISGTPSLYKKNMCELVFFSNTAEYKDNTAVFTSGMSDVYPRGMVIGKIQKKDGKLTVKTDVDFFKIRTLHLISPG